MKQVADLTRHGDGAHPEERREAEKKRLWVKNVVSKPRLHRLAIISRQSVSVRMCRPRSESASTWKPDSPRMKARDKHERKTMS